jgi:nicotinate-nucleotide adenylyltransferase
MFRKFLPEDNEKLKIGLLGGSFNPPHKGHLAISLAVMKKFQLQRVFWLVTPCNPNKNPEDYLNLTARVELCKKLVQKESNVIKILDLEKDFKNYYSANTITNIKKSYPKTNFYWIMGGDNLLTFHKWFKWQEIVEKVKLLVCERGTTALKASRTKLAQHLPLLELDKKQEKGFLLLHQTRIPISSSEIRKGLC